MAGKRGDRVRTEFYDPQLHGRLDYATNPARNRTLVLERFYLQKLTEMVTNQHTWKNLPDEVTGRFIEMSLLNHGLVIFFKETEKYNQYLAMRGGSNGELNIYDNPTGFHVQGGSGQHLLQLDLTIDECVPIWANNLRSPVMPDIIMWASRLAEIDRTIEISFANARQTKMVSVPEELKHSANEVLKQMAEGVGTVVGTPELAQILKSFETVDLESHPSKILNLLISKGKVWNEIMTFMGVNNSNQDKKERLVSDEVAANDEQIDLIKATYLSTREQACEEINKMFPGLKVSVEFNQTDVAVIDGANMGMSANAIPQNREPAGWN